LIGNQAEGWRLAGAALKRRCWPVRKTSGILAVVAVALGLSASVDAANTPTSGGGATVTKATLPSGYSDSTGFYPATCDETQVVNENQRKETFNCTFDTAAPAPIVCDTSSGFSDFDGALASRRTS
jgi:hypothetical protein